MPSPSTTSAAQSDTVNYEKICLVGKRVPRVYRKGGMDIGVAEYLKRILTYSPISGASSPRTPSLGKISSYIWFGAGRYAPLHPAQRLFMRKALTKSTFGGRTTRGAGEVRPP